MPDLPACRWRGPEGPADRFPCSSPRLIVLSPTVSADTCRGCGVCDLPARPDQPERVKERECRHLGKETEETVECVTCQGRVRLKLMSCAVHGRCTTRKPVNGVACCVGCKDREPGADLV